MDSLRAIAVLGVFLTHASYFVAQSGPAVLERFRFDMGVSVFFVISGFLIYRPWVRARLRGEPSPVALVYAWRRLLRIVPGYWVALTAVALVLGVNGLFSWSGTGIYYGLLQAYFPYRATGGLTQAWSLCVELAFYVFVPLYALALTRIRSPQRRRRLRHELIGIGALVAVSTVYKVAVLLEGTLETPNLSVLQLNLPTFIDVFAVGMLLATLSVWYEQRGELPRALQLVDRRSWLPWAFAAAAFALASFGIGVTGALDEHMTSVEYMERHYLALLTAGAVVLPAIYGDFTRGWVRRLLGNRVMLYVGLISYGIFLYHFAVLTQLERWGFTDAVRGRWPSLLWLVAGLAGSVLVATLSYYLVERPFLDLKRLVRDPRWRAERGEAIEEPVPATPPHVHAGAG